MSEKKPRVVAIIQARMGSSRRPGKTLADISGKPLIWHVVERTRASQTVDAVVLATTTEENDQQLLKIAEEYGILGYAGSLNDVLDRFYQAACLANAEVIVRVTADDPFKDPQVIDRVVNYLAGSSGVGLCQQHHRADLPGRAGYRGVHLQSAGADLE